jgi:chromosome segregation ATPase
MHSVSKDRIDIAISMRGAFVTANRRLDLTLTVRLRSSLHNDIGLVGKVNALEIELDRLRSAAREAQTAEDLARAQQPMEKARQLIVDDYAKAAREIAETLARLETIETELRALNARLPIYAGHIQIEGFRGNGATLGRAVVLPAIAPDDAAFWPTRPRLQTLNEIYARN